MTWWDIALALLLAIAGLFADTPPHAFGLDCVEDEVVAMVVADPGGRTGQFVCLHIDLLD